MENKEIEKYRAIKKKAEAAFKRFDKLRIELAAAGFIVNWEYCDETDDGVSIVTASKSECIEL